MPQPNSLPVRDENSRFDEPLLDDVEPGSTRELDATRERESARDSVRERAERERPRQVAQARAQGSTSVENTFGTSYLRDGSTDESWEHWRQIQANFVDDPRNAVSEAHGLVSELVDGIVRQFESERTQLEQRWSSGEDVSTEDLRRCLQRYRDFFGRLLANFDAKP